MEMKKFLNWIGKKVRRPWWPRIEPVAVAAGLALLLSVSGCVIPQQVAEFTMADLNRAAEIAAKGKDDVAAMCYRYLAGAIDAQLATANEDTNGLISAYEQVRVLRNQSTAGRQEFEAKCGGLVTDIVVTIGRKAASRGMAR